ncbi:hypothetical protein BVRB_6g131300 [Beta vulgaris subsp. vulgaris]|nr:hypothetical protein BVRB_6g131300 [Beta vulgaris subsp. vulgaris]
MIRQTGKGSAYESAYTYYNITVNIVDVRCTGHGGLQ